MTNCPHTNFRKGQKILIIFNDGTKKIDKFEESKSGVILCRKLGRINVSDIRATSIFKPTP